MLRTSAASPAAVISSTESSATGSPAGGSKSAVRSRAIAGGTSVGARGASTVSLIGTTPIPWRSAHAPKEWARSPAGTSWSRRRTGRAAASAARNAFSVPLGSRSPTTSTSASCSHRARDDLAGGGRGQGRGVREAAVDGGVETAEQARHRGQRPPALLARAGDHRIQVARVHAFAAEVGQRARQRAGQRAAGQVRRHLEAAVVVEQPLRDQRVVPGVPGRQPASEERRLGERAQQVAQGQRVEAGDGLAARGEAAGDLQGRGPRRNEEDQRTDGHRVMIILHAGPGRTGVPHPLRGHRPRGHGAAVPGAHPERLRGGAPAHRRPRGGRGRAGAAGLCGGRRLVPAADRDQPGRVPRRGRHPALPHRDRDDLCRARARDRGRGRGSARPPRHHDFSPGHPAHRGAGGAGQRDDPGRRGAGRAGPRRPSSPWAGWCW